jgi:hypothetical protein
MTGLRATDLKMLVRAGNIVMQWLPESKLSASAVTRLREAIKRAKKIIDANKN